MKELIVFLLVMTFASWISRASLRHPSSHGFARYVAWLGITALLLCNYPFWLVDRFSPLQVISWLLLFVAAALIIHAVHVFRRFGQPSEQRRNETLFPFERTSQLVTCGIYRYIRHPMYASLLYMAWGVFLKQVSVVSSLLIALVTVALVITALRDEKESLDYFAEDYRRYMQNTRRFIPFVW